MNAELKSLYTSKWADLERITQDGGVSWPLLLNVLPEYGRAKRRLLVVGQQTHGWSGYGDDTSESRGSWKATLTLPWPQLRIKPLFGRRRASHMPCSTPTARHRVFCGPILVKVIKRDIDPLQMSRGSIRVGVFFTGPSYDSRLCATFPAIRPAWRASRAPTRTEPAS
jgi:hypothetical protein